MCLPDPQRQAAARQFDTHLHFLSMVVACRDYRQVCRIAAPVIGNLVPVTIKTLGEITTPVEYADADEGYPQVAHGLAIIGGQYPESAGIDGHTFVKTVLGREVGDQVGVRIQQVIDACAGHLLHVGIVTGERLPVFGQQDRVLRRLVDVILAHAAEKHLWTVGTGIPAFQVQVTEQPGHAAVPAVVQVIGKLAQAFETFRQHGTDFNTVAGTTRLAGFVQGATSLVYGSTGW
jgi:hypothetical protein